MGRVSVAHALARSVPPAARSRWRTAAATGVVSSALTVSGEFRPIYGRNRPLTPRRPGASTRQAQDEPRSATLGVSTAVTEPRGRRPRWPRSPARGGSRRSAFPAGKTLEDGGARFVLRLPGLRRLVAAGEWSITAVYGPKLATHRECRRNDTGCCPPFASRPSRRRHGSRQRMGNGDASHILMGLMKGRPPCDRGQRPRQDVSHPEHRVLNLKERALHPFRKIRWTS